MELLIVALSPPVPVWSWQHWLHQHWEVSLPSPETRLGAGSPQAGGPASPGRQQLWRENLLPGFRQPGKCSGWQGLSVLGSAYNMGCWGTVSLSLSLPLLTPVFAASHSAWTCWSIQWRLNASARVKLLLIFPGKQICMGRNCGSCKKIMKQWLLLV